MLLTAASVLLNTNITPTSKYLLNSSLGYLLESIILQNIVFSNKMFNNGCHYDNLLLILVFYRYFVLTFDQKYSQSFCFQSLKLKRRNLQNLLNFWQTDFLNALKKKIGLQIFERNPFLT